MKCCHCNTELIWGGDENVDDSDEYTIQTNLTCPECNTFYLVYTPNLEEKGIKNE